MDKKGELTSNQIITIVILIVSFGIILIFFASLAIKGEIGKDACRTSVTLRSIPILGENVRLNCPTQDVCFSKTNECDSALENTQVLRVSEKNDMLKELAELKAKQKRVYEMREDGEYDKVQFTDRLAEVENKIMATTISLNETKIEQFDIESTVTYATKFISNLSRIWFDLSPELKPRFQKLVFPQGVLYDTKNKFRTTKLGYIYELNQKMEAVKSPFSETVDPSGLEPLTSSLQMRRSTR